MTQNQIAYWANKERERSNRANESELARGNRAKEGLTAEGQTETKRSNLAREGLTAEAQDETHRHNYKSEALVGEKQQTDAYNASTQRRKQIMDNDATVQRNLQEAADKRAQRQLEQDKFDYQQRKDVADTIIGVVSPWERLYGRSKNRSK